MKDFIIKQKAISFTKQLFTSCLEEMGLIEVCAPMLVRVSDGVQDSLSGQEQAVAVHVKALQESFEVIHSLAKWKRQILKVGRFQPGTGIYTHMKALRPDEDMLDKIHSVYVDQWDWEMTITAQNRTLDFLKKIVAELYSKITKTHKIICEQYKLEKILPEQITFIHAQQLLDAYPDLTPAQRENEICKKHGAVFVIGIGGELTDGTIHDNRAPDYDDWSTINSEDYKGLNGDILVWNPILSSSFEISSMGIRVDKAALIRQLAIKNKNDDIHRPWHQSLINETLPLSIGGGIGVSRMVMLMLQKNHIGQVQFGSWAKNEIEKFDLLNSFEHEVTSLNSSYPRACPS